MPVNWGRVLAIVWILPTTAIAAIAVWVFASDFEVRHVGHMAGDLLVYQGRQIAYGTVTFGAVIATHLGTRWWVNRWWHTHGQIIAEVATREKNATLKRERNQLDYRLRVRTRELREEQQRNRAAHELLERVVGAAGAAQMALRMLPADEPDEDEKLPVIRRVN